MIDGLRRNACLFFDGRNDHSHKSAVEHGDLIDSAVFLYCLTELLKDFLAALLMAHLSTSETKHYLDLVAIAKESYSVLHLGFEIVRFDTAGQLNLLNLDNVLLLFRFLLAFFLLEAVSSVVYYAAYGGLSVGGNENEIESLIVCNGTRRIRAHYAELVAVGTYNSDLFEANVLIE